MRNEHLSSLVHASQTYDLKVVGLNLGAGLFLLFALSVLLSLVVSLVSSLREVYNIFDVKAIF